MRTFWIVIMMAVALFAAAQDFKPRTGETYLRVVVEGRGTMWIKLHTAEAPKTTARIMALASDGFYDGQRFFEASRSPRPYMARTGDPNSRTKPMGDRSLGTYSTGTKIPYEDSGFKHVEGAVGMGHLPGDKDSGDCQFYIMLGPSGFLDGQYTVFGQVVSGMEVLRKVELGDRITSVSVVKG
ncbi:MAG TPA: peptidylprolyl isomerase [Fimbriimonadaceae bacterium]|nr:peptidylprolyl isomerase [Fimbriimonadaceae bacterium]HRJ95052.1 peptidylprolyl isomerase [Fimbriimonadaceae bacterium]